MTSVELSTNEPAVTEWAEAIARVVEAMEKRQAISRDIEHHDNGSTGVSPVTLVIDEAEVLGDSSFSDGVGPLAKDDVLAFLKESRLLEYGSVPLAVTRDGRTVDVGFHNWIDHAHTFGAASGGKSLTPGTSGSGEVR